MVINCSHDFVFYNQLLNKTLLEATQEFLALAKYFERSTANCV